VVVACGLQNRIGTSSSERYYPPILAHAAVRSAPCKPSDPRSPPPPPPPDYYALLRFLRARNYEHDKAFKMWCDSLSWRREFEVDEILDSFVFHEREQFLMAYVSLSGGLPSALGGWSQRRWQLGGTVQRGWAHAAACLDPTSSCCDSCTLRWAVL